jgi:hypothetical protein
MRRFVIMTAGLLAGTVVGAVLVMAAQGVSTTPPSTVEVAALFPTSHETGVTGGGAHSDESTPTSSSEPVPISDQVLLV